MFTIRRLFCGFFLVSLMAAIVWVSGFFWFMQQIPTSVEDETTTTDAIVVLTGGSGRLLAGINLLERGKAQKLLISGVGEKSTIRDLQNLSDEVISNQVRPLEARIMLGHLAYNTQTNAIETAIWMELQRLGSLRLVTANYHIPRSMAMFQAEMPHVRIVPNPVFPENFKLSGWWKFSGSAKLLASEYMKFLAVKLALALNLHIAPTYTK